MRTTLVLRACAAAAAIAFAHASPAQSAPVAPSRSVSAALEQRIDLHAHDAALRDVFVALEHLAGFRLNPLWTDDDHTEGLDPGRLIQIDCSAQPAIQVLETILRRADSAATWQLDSDGAIEVGPRSRLNEHRRTEIYPVHDLLTLTPNYPQAAAIDLQAALQSQSASPLREPSEPEQRESDARKEREQTLVDLITATIEPSAWVAAGGTAADIQIYQNSLIVTAPGYIHRQLVGREPAPNSLRASVRVTAR